jgi:hypothetical protein
MIKLYRPADCPDCEEIEAVLQELVISHQVIVVENRQNATLEDSGQLYRGQQAIKDHLQELEKIVADWRRFQSDACYIDDDGETC